MGHVSDRFSDPFSRFSNRFSYRFKKFSGAVSFCRHAALKNPFSPSNVLSAILGPEMAAPNFWAPCKCARSAGKTHVHKIPPFSRGGVGGGSADFIFMGARMIFLMEGRSKIRQIKRCFRGLPSWGCRFKGRKGSFCCTKKRSGETTKMK